MEEVAASRRRATKQSMWWRMSSNLLLNGGGCGQQEEGNKTEHVVENVIKLAFESWETRKKCGICFKSLFDLESSSKYFSKDVELEQLLESSPTTGTVASAHFAAASKPFPPHNIFGRPGAKRVAVYLGCPSRDDVYFRRIPDHTDQDKKEIEAAEP
ncbi:hypothetical protein SUGI_0821690 [Cryptomeria japonica]|nr:hypothetical protein SUGI_0821690 [Cryptomeria japonica]